MLRCRPGSTLFPRRSTRRTPATWCASACHADSLSCLPTSVHTISPQSAESVRAATCAGVDTRSMSAAIDACSVRCCLVATPPAHDAARSPAVATNSFTAVAFQHDVLCNAVTLRSLSAHAARTQDPTCSRFSVPVGQTVQCFPIHQSCTRDRSSLVPLSQTPPAVPRICSHLIVILYPGGRRGRGLLWRWQPAGDREPRVPGPDMAAADRAGGLLDTDH